MDIPVHNAEGGVVGSVTIDDALLGDKVRTKLLHQAIIRYEANKRLGTHAIKSKAQRSGSGVKPFKQKHTGRARAGMKRSPLWRGGGNAFGPRPRDYHQDMPVRMRREALKSALLSKIRDQEFTVIDQLDYATPKTKKIVATLKALKVTGSCLVSDRKPVTALVKSVRNIANCSIMPARNLNAYDVLKHKHVLLTKDTVEHLTEVVKA